MRKSSSRRARVAYAGLATGTVAAAVFIAPQAAFAAAAAVPPVGPASGTVTVTDSTAAFTSATTLAAQLNASGSCPSTAPATSTTIFAATATKVDANSATVTIPSTAALGTSGVSKTYAICFYASAAATSAAIATSTVPTYTVTATSTLNPATGLSGGGNTLTVTAPTTNPYFTNQATPAAVFSTTSCQTLYPASPAANLTSTVTRSTATATANTVATIPVPTGVLGTGATAASYNVCIYSGTTAGTSTLLASTPYSVTLPALTLSSNIGPNAAGTGITAQSTANFLTGVTAPGAAFTTAASCPTTYPAAVTYAAGPPVVAGVIQSVSAARKLADNRLAVTVPLLPLIGTAPTTYQACFYNGTTEGVSTILAAAPYTSTTVPTPTGISPNAGPALGGTTITVIGTNFPTAAGSISATLGGAALTVTPVSATAFTAVTPAHGVENNVPLVVTTAAGSRVLQGAFSYTNALAVSPNTAPNTRPAVDVDIQGVGFLAATFGANNSRVYLVDGVYDGTDNGNTEFTNGPVSDCSNILVITDNELICTLTLNRRLNAAGATFNSITHTTALTGANTTLGSRVITITAGNGFTMDDLGQPIYESTPTNFGPNTTIAAVLSPTRALLSQNAIATGAAFAATIGARAVRTPADVTFTSGSTTVTSATAGTFTSADLGRVISGVTGITAGTTITGIGAGGNTATLSAPTTAAQAAPGNLAMFAAAAVPNGAYNLTYVSNGEIDAPSTQTNFTQSAVSSSSTFTVAPF
jgi:hypothetical protein